MVYWLIREYARKWGKSILVFFAIGLAIFFAIIFSLRFIVTKIPVGKNETVGVVGIYTVDSLPRFILTDISMGLTSISFDGTPKPAIAKSWKIEKDGKQYTFFLKNNIYFTNGTKLTSNEITYNFSDVSVTRPSKDRIVFTLKDSYSPFLITVSRPIFKKGFVGTGPYIVKQIKINGNFVQTLTLALKSDLYKTKTYQFYPSFEVLKVAYGLGEVSKAIGLSDAVYNDISFKKFSNTTVNKKVNYNQLISLFYNTTDNTLSDKRLRTALTYALPDTFPQGERAFGPVSPYSYAYARDFTLNYDLEQAKLLLSATQTGTAGAKLKVNIKTLHRYKTTAEEIAKLWKKIGVETKITQVDTVPTQFQMFLGNFFLPLDPDQYTLWHSNQNNNITNFDNKRIDKLLEDGRKITNLEERKRIYADFQKYLLADSPASFLYFPYEYELTRR